jgi:hypothetical protein
MPVDFQLAAKITVHDLLSNAFLLLFSTKHLAQLLTPNICNFTNSVAICNKGIKGQYGKGAPPNAVT